MTDELYTPSHAGSGQYLKCKYCKKDPLVDGCEVYDGCLGKLTGDIMNACCGHGDDDIAYIQYSDGSCVRGWEAVKEQRINIARRKLIEGDSYES